MVQTPAKLLSLEAFLQQPETKPASEYIDGQIIQKIMPKAEHSGLQTDLAAAINSALKPDRKARAFTELRCTFGDDRSLVPDITVLPWANIPRNAAGKLSGEYLAAPDWMIEILSPGQSQTKVFKKILYALEQGTKIGWLIDPAEDCVFGCTPDLRTILYDDADAQLPVPKFATDFQLTVGELLTWLYE